MKQYFTHYSEWEDFKNGLWSSVPKHKEKQKIQSAIDVLSDPEKAMQMVIDNWPVSSRVNLTDVRSNRKSWLGQAACCIHSGVPEHLTRAAWNGLTDEQKNNANNVAKQIIEQWEKDYLG